MTFKKIAALAVLVAALCPVFAFGSTALAEQLDNCGHCTCTFEGGTLTIAPIDGTDGKLASCDFMDWPWSGVCGNIQTLVIQPGVSTAEGCAFMFGGCSSLTTANLANLNTSAATDMSYMFCACENLLSLDLSSFDTSKVTNMGKMFMGCYRLPSLDLSSFDTSNVKDMSAMFSGNGPQAALKTIIVDPDKWSTDAVIDSADMFGYCANLVGGNGTTYTTGHLDATYARVDGGPDSTMPGYLTGKVTVNFDGNGGTGSMNPQSFTQGIPQQLTKNAFTKTGCTFLGWSTNQSAASADYSDEEEITVNAGMKLYAIWQENPATPTPTPAPVPETGDNTPTMLMVGLLLLSGAALIMLRKRTTK